MLVQVGQRGVEVSIKTQLAMTQDNLLPLTLLETRALGWMISRGPFPPKLFCDTSQIRKGIMHVLQGGLESTSRTTGIARGTTMGETAQIRKQFYPLGCVSKQSTQAPSWGT